MLPQKPDREYRLNNRFHVQEFDENHVVEGSGLDKEKFNAGFEAIVEFNRCKDHPGYKAKRKPTADCAKCRRLWREAQLAKDKSKDDVEREA